MAANQPNPHLVLFQRRMTHKFKQFREHGQYVADDDNSFMHDFLTHPRPQGRRGFRGLRGRSGFSKPRRGPYFHDEEEDLGPAHSEESATKGRKRLWRKLRPHQLFYQGLLGWGGNGVAVLFYRRIPAQENARDYFVAKCCLDQNLAPRLMREKESTAVCPRLLAIFTPSYSHLLLQVWRVEPQANQDLVLE